MQKSLLFTISLLVVSMFLVNPVYSGTTVLYVSPSSIIDTAKVAGTTFTVEINVKDVTDLYIFDFTLNYTATVLTGPPPLEIGKGSFFPPDSMIWKNETNDVLGYVRYILGLPPGTPRGQGISGSGTLAIIQFTVDSDGGSSLILSNTKLSDSYSRPIAHTAYNGYFSNKLGVPKLDVYPDGQGIINQSLVPGKNFTINVNVSNVTDLYRSEFKLTYNTELLDTVSISEGNFLKSYGPTSFTQNVNETEGSAWINLTLIGPIAGAGGKGVLAEITFNVTNTGATTLHFFDHKLINSEGTLIEHFAVDGYFSNRPIVHDMAITKVTTTINTVKVEQGVTVTETKVVDEVHPGDHVNITVTVKNNGTMTETFDITVYYGNTKIGTKNGTILSEGASTTINIEWNTDGIAVGEYTVWAEASTVTAETDTANNRLEREGKFTVLTGDQSLPIELIVGAVVAIIAVIAIAVYFFKIRKTKAD